LDHKRKYCRPLVILSKKGNAAIGQKVEYHPTAKETFLLNKCCNISLVPTTVPGVANPFACGGGDL
jgi:hypothetical protein